MFAWKPQASGHIALGEPSPLLTHIAGEFAAPIAGLWPKPHAVFLTADAPRRHLLCLRLAVGGPDDLGAVVEPILHGAFKAAIAAALPAAPAGLKRALEHMGETAWHRAAYLSLLDLLAHPQAAKVLRHAASVEAEQIAALAALPAPMLEAGGGRLGLNLHLALITAEIFAGLVMRDGEDSALAACRRWGGAATARDALGLMQEDLTPRLPPPPFVGTARLRPIRTQAEVRDAALRYRNCLRDFVPVAAGGATAFYEWLGDPRAVVQITRDGLFGWRLCQARLADNAAVPETVRCAIRMELSAMGVHVGRADWQLRNALEEAAEDAPMLAGPGAARDYVFED